MLLDLVFEGTVNFCSHFFNLLGCFGKGRSSSFKLFLELFFLLVRGVSKLLLDGNDFLNCLKLSLEGSNFLRVSGSGDFCFDSLQFSLVWLGCGIELSSHFFDFCNSLNQFSLSLFQLFLKSSSCFWCFC